ncbi:MAG: hypothetical protein NVSMB1_12190 [Polyangiales bacterium]
MGVVASGCVAATDDNDSAMTRADEISIGIFAECELPIPVRRPLARLTRLLRSMGVELAAEAIIAYDHDLTNGANTIEILFGGEPAIALGHRLGKGWLLRGLAGSAGLLAAVTIPLNFDGSPTQIHWALDAFYGGDLYAAAGGRWKILWSSLPSEIGQEGFWASVTVATNGACRAGPLSFVSDGEINVIQSAWKAILSRRS